MTLKGFSQRWKDFPDYILGITREIWEDRGIETLNRYYADDIPVRTPMGLQRGNQAIMAATMATLREFPDRELLGEDVIWSGDEDTGFLSSHRLLTTGTHKHDGTFGAATGRRWRIRVIADCAAKNNKIYDEWLVRDYGGLVRQLGMEPRSYTAMLIESEGGAGSASHPFTPAQDIDGGYHGTGNDNQWGVRYEQILRGLMDKDFNLIFRDYDRAVIGEYSGALTAVSHNEVADFWMGLRAAFPDAEFNIHHRIGRNDDMMPPRAAIRWSLDGTHTGWGAFGRPTGAHVHIFGISHAEFGPWGLRREYSFYDEVAIWKQILMQTGV